MDFVYSDPHFGHERLRKIGRPEFETLEQMHEELIKRYNQFITDDHIKVYWLGDVGDKKYIEEFLPKMRGYKILILGNHDKYGKSFYRKYFDEIHETGIFWSKRILLSHHPLMVEQGFINVHGHTHLIDIDTGQHFNACVERTNYAPVKMEEYVKKLGNIETPQKRFLQEWYKDFQKPVLEREDLVLNKKGLVDIEKTKEHWKTIKPKEVLEKLEEN